MLIFICATGSLYRLEQVTKILCLGSLIKCFPLTLREASRENGWKVPDLSVVLQIIIICGHDNDQNLHRVIHFHINIPIFKMYLLKRFLLSCYPVIHLLQGKVPCLCHGPFRRRVLVIAHTHLHLCFKLGQCCFFS